MTKREQRAHAQRAFDAYKAIAGLDTGEDITTLVDLITDLLHLADTLDYECGLGGGASHVVDSALMHYDAERRFGDDEEQS